MIIQKTMNFFKSSNTPDVSLAYFNTNADVLSLQIDGDFTSGNFYIEGRNNTGGDWHPLAAIDLSNFSVFRNGLSTVGIYEIGITSVREIRARIESIEGGEVSIYGQFIATEEV